MLERRTPPPLNDGQRGAKTHRRHREPRQANGDELEDRPSRGRAAQPAPGAARKRCLATRPEPLVILVPRHTPRSLWPRGQQWQERDREVGIAPGAVREPLTIGGEGDGSAAAISQSQDRRAIVQRHDDCVDRERHQRAADAGPGIVVLAATLLQPLERRSRRGIGFPRIRRQHALGGGQPHIRLQGTDANAIADAKPAPLRAPACARRDAGTISRGHHGSARAHVAHDLLQLGVLQINDRIEQDENCGAMDAFRGECRE